MKSAQEITSSGNHDQITQAIDGYCLDKRWKGVDEIVESCMSERGSASQLWASAAYGQYRIMLDGPDKLVAKYLDSKLSRFTLGPFCEVASQNHSFDALKPYLELTPSSAVFAHECALRGQVIEMGEFQSCDPYALPTQPYDFEPAYKLATYEVDRVQVDSPNLSFLDFDVVKVARNLINPTVDPLCEAFYDGFAHWTTNSNGTVFARSCLGTFDAILATIYRNESLEVSELSLAQALELVAWASASGALSGKRRGASAGRSACLSLIGALGFLDDHFTTNSRNEELRDLTFYTWKSPNHAAPAITAPVSQDPGHLGGKMVGHMVGQIVGQDKSQDSATSNGWTINLGIHDEYEVVSWALMASDSPDFKSPDPKRPDPKRPEPQSPDSLGPDSKD